MKKRNKIPAGNESMLVDSLGETALAGHFQSRFAPLLGRGGVLDFCLPEQKTRITSAAPCLRPRKLLKPSRLFYR